MDGAAGGAPPARSPLAVCTHVACGGGGCRLSAEQREFLCAGFAFLPVETGETVIQQDESGDHFYIVASGTYKARCCHRRTTITTAAS